MNGTTTGFPGFAPRLLKGALVGRDQVTLESSVIVFQYNPDTLTRTVTARTVGGAGDSGQVGQLEALRLTGPPRETLQLDVEIDAADQLEASAPLATTLGIYPTLAALELLLYPAARVAVANDVLAAAGLIEIIPPEAPLTIFVWGARRVLPVRLTEFTIAEEAFDANLNPIRARVTLRLSTLTYQELGVSSAGGSLFLAHQVAKEAMASLYGDNTNALSGATATGVPLA